MNIGMNGLSQTHDDIKKSQTDSNANQVIEKKSLTKFADRVRLGTYLLVLSE